MNESHINDEKLTHFRRWLRHGTNDEKLTHASQINEIYNLTRENKHLRKENLKLLERLGEAGHYEYNSFNDSHEWVNVPNALKKDNCQEKDVDSDNLI